MGRPSALLIGLFLVALGSGCWAGERSTGHSATAGTGPRPAPQVAAVPPNDPQRTRRSPYPGPASAELAWRYPAGFRGSDGSTGVSSVPVLGRDGTIYVEVIYGDGSIALHALDPEGDLRWEYPLERRLKEMYPGNPLEQPLKDMYPGTDGTLYFVAGDVLHALAPDGTAKWTRAVPGGFHSALLVTETAVYAVAGYQSTLHAFTLQGEILWSEVNLASFAGFEHLTLPQLHAALNPGRAAPVLGADGTIWAGAAGFKPDGTVASFAPMLASVRAFGPDGTMFAETQTEVPGSRDVRLVLHAFNADRTERWNFEWWGASRSLALAPDGTAYTLGSSRPRFRTILTAISADGTVRWERDVDRFRGPAIGSDGTIYVVDGGEIAAIDPDGTLQWCFHFQGTNPGAGGLIVGPGRIYFNTIDGLLWAVGERSPRAEAGDPAWFPTLLHSYVGSLCWVADGLFPR